MKPGPSDAWNEGYRVCPADGINVPFGLMDAPRPESDLTGCLAAHRRLDVALEAVNDDNVGAPSRLPGWAVGHVLNHLRRNAEGLTSMMLAATAGEVADQYIGGAAGRDAGIADGADLPAAELVALVRRTSVALEDAWASAPMAAWDGLGRMMRGEMAMRDLPSRRWREVEVHLADLGLGFDYEDWSDAYVGADLSRFEQMWASRRPIGQTDLPTPVLALSPPRRLAWFLGRIEMPGVEPAGVYDPK